MGLIFLCVAKKRNILSNYYFISIIFVIKLKNIVKLSLNRAISS